LRPCDELIACPRSPTGYPDIVSEVKRKFSWRRARHELGCRTKEKITIRHYIRPFSINYPEDNDKG
jgi:hypothetical protein